MIRRKKIIITAFLFFSAFLLNSQLKISFIYKNNYYTIKPNKITDISIPLFNALKVIDQSQKHRLLLTTLEKSRLASLFYVGDKYEFNNVEIMLKYNQEYQITDKVNGFKIIFTTGEYDNIILYSAINFGDKKFNIIDKLASTFAVKYLFKKMIGKLEKKDIVIDDKGVDKSEVIKEYEKFIEQLKKLKKEEIFVYLKKYIELNFQLEAKRKITDNWTHPADLYFYKEGDYKSFAFFYYYTLKQLKLGFKVRSYLVSDLRKKSPEDLDRMHALFLKTNKNRDDLKKIQQIELQYKNVNPASNLKNFLYNYKNSNAARPPAIYFYYPPDFESSVFLVAVEIDDRWIYTTGDKWVDAGIYKTERVCNHYAKSGCYYAYIDRDFVILKNLAFSKKNILWDIFFSVK